MNEDRELALEISRNLQRLVERIDALEARLREVERRTAVIPVAEFLPRN